MLYAPKKRSLFAKFEEFLINTYFSGVFTKAILSVSNTKKGKFFEPGSGGGMSCVTLAKQGFDVTCLDLSKNALKKSKSLFNHMSLDGEFTQGTLFNLPIRDEQFNVVFNQGVMEHFRLDNLDPSKGVKEMMLLLKDGTTKKLELFKMVATDDTKISPLEDYDSHSFFTIIGYCKKR